MCLSWTDATSAHVYIHVDIDHYSRPHLPGLVNCIFNLTPRPHPTKTSRLVMRTLHDRGCAFSVLKRCLSEAYSEPAPPVCVVRKKLCGTIVTPGNAWVEVEVSLWGCRTKVEYACAQIRVQEVLLFMSQRTHESSRSEWCYMYSYI